MVKGQRKICGGTPKPPDPVKTAQAQAQYNTQAAKDAAALNAVDQYGPFGSTTYQRNPDGTPSSQTVNLSPEVAQWLQGQFGVSNAVTGAAQNQLGFLPQDRFQLPTGPNAQDIAKSTFGANMFDPGGFDASGIAQTSYDQAKSLFQPDIDAARKAKEIELGRRGIPVGSEIYNDEMDRLDRNANNAYASASRQATLDVGNEQTRRVNTALTGLNYGNNTFQTNLSNQLLERNQPFAEASALLGANPQFQTPSFAQTTPQGIAAPDYSGLVNQNYQQQLNASQNRFGSIAGLVGTGIQAAGMFSDENFKENRSPADGEETLAHLRRLPVDHYDYKAEARSMFALPESRTGTMAQDYAREFGGDGHTIDTGDAIGRLMAAVKALDKRTQGQRRAA